MKLGISLAQGCDHEYRDMDPREAWRRTIANAQHLNIDNGLTLNGEAYVAGTTYRDARGDVDLAADFEGIDWLRQNVEGSPVVAVEELPEGCLVALLDASHQFSVAGGRGSLQLGL